MEKWATIDLENLPEDPEDESEEEPEGQLEEETSEESDDESEGQLEEETSKESDDESEEQLEEETSKESEEEPEDRSEKETKRKSRATRRIRQLVSEKNAYQKKLEELQKENKKLKSSSKVSQKHSAQQQLGALEKTLDALKTRYRKEHEEGNIDQALDVQDQITETNMKILALKEWIEASEHEPAEETDDYKEIEETPEVDREQLIAEAPEALQDWLDENPWFTNAKTPSEIRRVRVAVNIAEELLEEGYTYEDPELFEEVDERLESMRLAKSGKTRVKSQSEHKDRPKDVKQRRKISQQIQGGSRTTNSRPSKKKTTLTESERERAKQLGVSESDYVKQKLLREQADKRGERYTTIMDPFA